MADDNGGGDPGLDPYPVGSTWGIGATATNPEDPLNDWASNLHQDDLANFLKDPEYQAQAWAARGHPPPNIEDVHDFNEKNGTPSRSTRFDTTPASNFDSRYGTWNNISPSRQATRGVLEQKVQGREPPAGGDQGLIMAAPAFPGGAGGEANPADNPERTPGAVFVPGKGYVDRTTGQLVSPPAAPPPGPGPAPDDFAGAAKKQVDRSGIPGSAYGDRPGVYGAPAPAPPVAAPAQQPTTANPLDPVKATEENKEEEKKETKDDAGETHVSKIGSALSDLGKAMQGVKAPGALQPPKGFAPAPHGPRESGAPQLASLLGLGAGGRPSLPILRLLGR